MHFTPEQIDKLALDYQSRVTAYDCLFTTVFASLLNAHSESERNQIRETILDGLRFSITGVPSEMPDDLSMQIQADAVAFVEAILNGVEKTIKRPGHTFEPSKE
jgi:hypothetical protein